MMNALRRALTPSRTAPLLVAVAAGAFLWHVLACTESPMAFSPDGRTLALTTMEPFDLKGQHEAGKHTWRLLVTCGGKDLKEIESTVAAMLTAPGWSPDGKELCYLRVPLLTAEEAKRQFERAQAKRKQVEAALAGEAGRSQGVWKDTSLEMPDAEWAKIARTREAWNPPVAAELVFRKTGDFSVARALPIDLPLSFWGKEEADDNVADAGWIGSYVEMAPRYSPDGKWIYLLAGHTLMAVNPETKERRILAVPGSPPRVSPDGTTIATLQRDVIAFLRTDGSKAVNIRLRDKDKLGLVGWVDKNTVALLAKVDPPSPGAAKAGEKTTPSRVVFMHTDGTMTDKALVLPARKDPPMEVAISPDGKHLAACFGQEICFLDLTGRLLGSVETHEPAPKDQELPAAWVQPVFAPDGKSLAVRQMKKDGAYRTAAVVFFSPEGKELSRVAIPAAPAPAVATRPAGKP